MHYHPEPDDPSRPPTYCWDHLPDDAKHNGYYECQCLREACVICEEADHADQYCSGVGIVERGGDCPCNGHGCGFC